MDNRNMDITDKLQGAQLISIDTDKIIVRKSDKTYVLHIVEEEGDCCGFNDIESVLFISEDEIKRNPIITSVKHTSGNDAYGGERAQLTFFGEVDTMAEIRSFSSSGSGWGYGASVTLKCKELSIEEVISEW